jgi:plastocyanin
VEQHIMFRISKARTLASAVALLALAPLALTAQSVAQHTPNLSNGLATLPGVDASARAGWSGDTVVVTIRNFRFSRERVTIDAGDVVVWRNADPVEHVIRDDHMTFESPAIRTAREWTHEFTAPGTYTYHSTPHPFMKAEIHVREMKR